MRKIVFIAIAALVITSFIFTSCAKPAPAPAPTPPPPKPAPAPPPKPEYPTMELILSTAHGPPAVNVEARATMRIWKEVEERTGGAITVEDYWGGAMSGPFDTPDLLQEGVIHLSHTMPWYTETKFPLANFLYVFPLRCPVPKTAGLAKHQMYKEIPAFQEMYAQYNMRELWAWGSVDYAWNSVKPLTSIEDFKGRKFTAATRWQNTWMKELGLTMISASVADVYELHQTGVAEGNMLPITLNIGLKVYEVAPYYLIGLGSAAYATMLINLDTWNAFGPEVQNMIEELADEALSDWYPPMQAEEIIRIKGIMESEGVEFTSMDEKFRQDILDIIPDVPAIWAEEVTGLGWPGWEIVDRWQELMDEYGCPLEREWGKR